MGCKGNNPKKSKKRKKKCEIFSVRPPFCCQRGPFFRKKEAWLSRDTCKLLVLCVLRIRNCHGNDCQGNNNLQMPRPIRLAIALWPKDCKVRGMRKKGG